MKKRYLFIILIILSIVSVSIGASSVTFRTLVENPNKANFIIFTSRVPRLLALIISSLALSIAGIIFQQISRNKFVAPSTAATLDGAKFGLALSFILLSKSSVFVKSILAFLFSLLTTFIFVKLTAKIKFKRGVYIPLVGIMLGYFINAATVFIAFRFDIMQSLATWFYGDFSKIIKGQYELLYLAIPVFILTYMYLHKFTIISLGEDFSTNLGIDYKKVVNMGLVIIALLSSLTVIVVGNIPFLGLIIPNILSVYYGDNLKETIKVMILIAPIFIIICDIIGRVIIYPYELPIGLTGGVIGAIIFLVILTKEKR